MISLVYKLLSNLAGTALVHVPSLNSIYLVQFHSARSLNLHFTRSISQSLRVLILLLIVMPLGHRMELSDILTIPSLTVVLGACACSTLSSLTSGRFLSGKGSLTLLSASGLLERPLPLLGIGCLLLLLLLTHYFGYDSAHLEVLGALELLDNHLQVGCLNQTSQLLETAGAIPHVIRQVDLGQVELVQ